MLIIAIQADNEIQTEEKPENCNKRYYLFNFID